MKAEEIELGKVYEVGGRYSAAHVIAESLETLRDGSVVLVGREVIGGGTHPYRLFQVLCEVTDGGQS
jgi:hypothetical protein